jgi:hypothetical protein
MRLAMAFMVIGMIVVGAAASVLLLLYMLGIIGQ